MRHQGRKTSRGTCHSDITHTKKKKRKCNTHRRLKERLKHNLTGHTIDPRTRPDAKAGNKLVGRMINRTHQEGVLCLDHHAAKRNRRLLIANVHKCSGDRKPPSKAGTCFLKPSSRILYSSGNTQTPNSSRSRSCKHTVIRRSWCGGF